MRDLFLSLVDVLTDELDLFAGPERGNKWKATVGWFRTVGKRTSKGKVPSALRFRVFIFSDMKRKAARSARRTWCTETGVYPGGAGRWR